MFRNILLFFIFFPPFPLCEQREQGMLIVTFELYVYTLVDAGECCMFCFVCKTKPVSPQKRKRKKRKKEVGKKKRICTFQLGLIELFPIYCRRLVYFPLNKGLDNVGYYQRPSQQIRILLYIFTLCVGEDLFMASKPSKVGVHLTTWIVTMFIVYKFIPDRPDHNLYIQYWMS